MVDVQTEVVIKRPIAEVAKYAMNPDNTAAWYVNIKSVEWITKPPLTQGTQIAFKAKFLGKDLAYTYEFVELVPNERLVMKTADGSFPMETTYTFMAIDSKTTKMTLRNQGNPSGFSKFVAPFMSTMMRKANNADLQMIKGILEDK